jgi:hypothetical protein
LTQLLKLNLPYVKTMNLASEKRAKDGRGDHANVHSEMREQAQTQHI